MNKFESVASQTAGKAASYLKWLIASLLVVFVTGCGGDGAPVVIVPTVSSTIPTAGATGIATNRKITATFSKDMAPATITSTTFTLTGPGVTPIVGDVTYAAGARTATFTPTAPATLPSGTVFTATITTGATDLAGTALATAKTWTFTTGAATDATVPTVSSTSPAAAATGVARNANITATFDEAMDAATITDVTFTLTQGATPVSGAVSYLGTTAIFNPTSDLAASTVYTATVTTGAADLAGNPLAATAWSFTTGTTTSAGPAPVLLGTAGNFVILAKTAVSTVPNSVITGDVGVSPAATTYLTGFSLTMVGTTAATSTQVTGSLYGADMTPPTDSNLTTAVLNMEAAYTDAATRPAPPDFLNLGAGEIGGQTLAPGLYTWTTGVTISTDVTISGGPNDVWIFQIPGNLTMSAAKNVILGGNAKAKNIFWQVAGFVDIGTTAHFEGILLSQTAITLKTGATMNGRALAQSAVALDQSTVVTPAP